MKKQLKYSIALLTLMLGMVFATVAQTTVTESFDGITFPPTGWSTSTTSSLVWSRVTEGTYPTTTPHSGAGFAKCNSFSASSGTASLVTPVLDYSMAPSHSVSFWMYRDNAYLTNADRIEVFVNTTATTAGATLLGTVNRSINLAPVEAANGWYQYTFAVPGSFNGTSNFLILAGTSTYGNNMYIDDVTYDTFIPAPGIAGISAPANGALGVSIASTLNWAAPSTGGLPVGYYVSIGTDNPPTNIANGVNVGNVLMYDPNPDLAYATQYYWQVVPYNATGSAVNSPVWSFATSLGIGSLEGFVTNGFGIPMAGVTVNVVKGIDNYTTTSAANGAYTFNLISAGSYTLTASFSNYNNTVINNVVVAPNVTSYQNISMLRPAMAITPNPYSVAVNPNELLNGALNIANNGDGVLGWTASVSYTSPGPNTWLTIGQAAGTVAAYNNFSVPMAFNASGLTAGTVKTAEVTFTSTPNVGVVVVPVTMTVGGTAFNVPANFTAEITNPVTGTVALAWTATGARAFLNYIILRNGVQVGTTTGTTFNQTLPAYGVYSYTLVAVYEEGNSAPAGPVVVEWANPTLVLTPASLYNEQYPVTSEAVSFRVSNTGEGTLTYSFPEYAARQLVNAPGFTPNVRSSVKEVAVAKGEVDPTDNQGNRNLRGAGGPDAFGYTWIDSDEAGGPAYVWNDIAGTGTLVSGLSDDNVVGPFNLGFSFPFYENTYSDISVSSNGYLIFGGTSSSLTNQNIPSATTPNNVIAWCWDDLHGAGPASTVHYKNMGNYWIIQFTNYNQYPSTGTARITAQVVLNQNGDIQIYYKDLVGGFSTTSATVGIENNTGTIATNVNYNSAYIHSNLAVWFGLPTPSFITSVVPASGQVAPGAFVDVVATFTSDNDEFPVGTYTNELELNTNDLANANVLIPATMVVYNPGMISGNVTATDDNAPVYGAVVTAGTYTTTTNDEGNYSIIVDAGSYNMTFSKAGYTSVAVAGVVVTETNTTVVDVELEEISYAPTLVNAVVNAADTQTDVTWGVPTPSYEALYDDGTAENFAAWALPGNMNAVKFTPAGYPATVYGGKVFVGDGSFPNNTTGFIGTTFGAMVKAADGANGMPGTTLDSITVTVNNLGWVEFNGLNATVTSGSFYLVMVQGAVSPNCAPVGIDQNIPTVYRSYSRNVTSGGAWSLSPYQDMMIRAFISGPVAGDASRIASSEIRTPAKQRGMISQSHATAQSGVEGNGQFLAIQDGASTRDLTSYKVWRVSGFNPNVGPEAGTLTLIDDAVEATNYTDAAFGPLTQGWYAYAVAANYTTGGESVKVFSNIVGHKLLVDVTCNVSLTTGGSPAGAVVTLVGQDYPNSTYTQTVPESGTVVFADIWKGNYVLEAAKVGFDDYTITPNITSNRTFDILLAERKYIPRNLYVDGLTLVATWNEPLAIAVVEDFEGSVFPPAGWQVMTQNTNGWVATTNGSSTDFVIPAHTKYAVTNDDGANGDGSVDYMMTPVMDWTDLPSYRMNFASYYDGTFGHSAYVEISTDGGATWTVINTLSPATTWVDIEIDLAQFSGATGLNSVMVAFHADDNGEWASGWAVDDVQIASGGVPLQGYGVFLDGTLVDNTPETTFTFTNLNYGQEYLAGVAALFTSGYSALDTYRFTCSYLIPPTNLAGESPALTNYAHLTWEAPTGGSSVGGSLTEDFEAGVLSADWEIIETNTSAAGGTPSYFTVNDYVSADFSPFGTYHAGLWWAESHQDEWLITPEVACGASTTLSFESTVFEGSTYLDHYYVKVSTDGGATWTAVWDASTLTGGGWNYYDFPYSIDLSAFAGEDIKIAFHAIDGDGAGLWYIWFVDNITVGDAESTVMFPASSLTKVSNSTNRSNSDRIARDGNTARIANSTERTNRAVMGLIGYNVYRDNALTAFVEQPALEYFDLNLLPATYSYHITAVYDLTPYGFAGQTGESMIEGPVDVVVYYGYELPFTEDFSTGLFETNKWTVAEGNWRMAGQVGNDAPAAEFYFNPATADYNQSLTSFYMIGTGVIDGKIMLDFDLKHTLVNATEDEVLAVEVSNNNGVSWVKVAEYKNTASFDWGVKSIDITNYAKNKVFQVRFTASGASTLDIFNWLLDNVNIYRVCAPPINLVSAIDFPEVRNVLLTWEAPEGGGTGGVSAWLAWDDGTNADAIGLTGGGTFSVAVRFTPAQLAEYAGTSLTKIRMFPYAAGGSIILKVWTGANAGQLVLSQPIASYTPAEWNEFTLTTPVAVTGATELWFGYSVTHGADYVAGCDAGPAVAGFGDMLSTDGSVWESMATAYNLNFNWNLQGFVESVDGVTALSPIVDNTVYGPASQPVRGNLPTLANATLTNNTTSGSRELVGYNVWRDGVVIANTTETTYLDTELVNGTYCYTVSAVYEDCESVASNEECETITGVTSLEAGAVSVYPNPSNSVVNIELTSNISQVVVYNYVGQVVFEQNVTRAQTIQLNVRNYESGAYLVKFITSAGESFTKKVVVTK